jgi:putative endonuclease
MSAPTQKPRSKAPRTAANPSTVVIGGDAERVACDYLASHGYRIVETNYRCKLGELDVIAEDQDGVLCFVEVRSRTRGTRDYGSPVETIGQVKRRRIIRAAEQYIFTRQVDPERAMRFDVVGVIFEPNHVTLELIRDAFQTN